MTTSALKSHLNTNKFGCLIEIIDETAKRHIFDARYDGNVMSKTDAFAVINRWIASQPRLASKINELSPAFNEDDAEGVMLNRICRAVKGLSREEARDEIKWHVNMAASLIESNYWFVKVDYLDPAVTPEAAEFEPIDAAEFKRRVQEATIGGF